MSLKEKYDGWMNLVTSLGTSRDKRMASEVIWDHRSQEEYEQMYSGDEIAAKIVDVVPEEALRRWVEFTGVDKNCAKTVNKICTKLEVRSTIERAWKWARHTGGAIIYIVTDTNRPDEPLQKGERILALRDLSRYDLRILSTDIENDFGSPNYGRPKIYYLNVQMGSTFKAYPIHASRVIRFDGVQVPRRTYIRNNYWHDSVLNRLTNPIRNYQTANDAAATILHDFSTLVFKMKNLANLMTSAKGEQLVKNRIEGMAYGKSVINALVVDSDDEEIVDLSRNITGVSDLLSKQANRLVAATNIPHTKFLGESPDGSNSTGNSTTSSWYDSIQSEQENYLRPKLHTLFSIMFPELPDLDFKFPKLWQLDELEEADLRNKQAQTDAIYIANQVLDPTEVAKSRFGGDAYSTETRIDDEVRELRAAEADPVEEVKSDEIADPAGDDGVLNTPDDPNDPGDGTGAAPYHPTGKQAPRVEQVESKTEKQSAKIGIAMSEPMRDPSAPTVKVGTQQNIEVKS